MRNLVIFGLTDAAELAHYYFSRQSEYEVVAFCADSKYINTLEFCGKAVVPFENLTANFPPDRYDLFIAVGYSKLNQIRMEKYLAAKAMGYRLATYVSPAATVLNDGGIGENCFILEDNTIQPFASIGNNVTLWSGNHIGHHSSIGDHCFLASHIVVSGRVKIGDRCFVGVNATFRDNISIGAACIIGAGSLILSDVEAGGVYVEDETARSRVPSDRVRRI
jgi:sugar O-acyltransferase (sialic acid O-acetyltransferase NeuD family)